MATETRSANVPTATVAFDRPRRLAFTLGALRRLKETLGMPLEQINEVMTGPGMIDHLHEVAWCLLVEDDRADLMPADLEELIHGGNMNALIEAVEALSNGSQPEKGAEGNAPKRAPATKRAAGKR